VLLSRLSSRGFTRVVLAGADASEQSAREAGLELFAQVSVRVEGAQLVVAGDVVPVWVNFWAGRDSSRPPGGRPLVVRMPADAQTFALAHLPALPSSPLRFTLRPLASHPEQVTALAAGEVDGVEGGREIVALTPTAVLVLRADGTVAAQRPLSAAPAVLRPREAAGTVALVPAAGEPSGVRIAARCSARADGELFGWRAGALVPAGVPSPGSLGQGARGAISGAIVPGTHLFEARVELPGSPPLELPFRPVAIAANARDSGPEMLAVGGEGEVALVSDGALLPVNAPFAGAGAALADLDGEGTTELILSGRGRERDRVRVFALREGALSLVWESQEVPGAFMAGASSDLDADGADEAVLAAWERGKTVLYVLEVDR